MRENPTDIISDEAIIRVHANANFGTMSPRAVVNDTVVKFAFGYDTGHTAMCIALEHKLASKPRGYLSVPMLTRKGVRYFRAIAGCAFNDVMTRVRQHA